MLGSVVQIIARVMEYALALLVQEELLRVSVNAQMDSQEVTVQENVLFIVRVQIKVFALELIPNQSPVNANLVSWELHVPRDTVTTDVLVTACVSTMNACADLLSPVLVVNKIHRVPIMVCSRMATAHVLLALGASGVSKLFPAQTLARMAGYVSLVHRLLKALFLASANAFSAGPEAHASRKHVLRTATATVFATQIQGSVLVIQALPTMIVLSNSRVLTIVLVSRVSVILMRHSRAPDKAFANAVHCGLVATAADLDA